MHHARLEASAVTAASPVRTAAPTVMRGLPVMMRRLVRVAVTAASVVSAETVAVPTAVTAAMSTAAAVGPARGNRLELARGKLTLREVTVHRKCHPYYSCRWCGLVPRPQPPWLRRSAVVVTTVTYVATSRAFVASVAMRDHQSSFRETAYCQEIARSSASVAGVRVDRASILDRAFIAKGAESFPECR
jgi:hypothetical protein